MPVFALIGMLPKTKRMKNILERSNVVKLIAFTCFTVLLSGCASPIVLAPGQTIVLSPGCTVRCPAGTAFHTADMNTVVFNNHGAHTTLSVGTKVKIEVPANATGEADNVITIKR